MNAALTVSGLTKVFAERKSGFGFGRRREFVAVDDVSFEVAAGRTLCLVGESGCGKTTIGRIALRLTDATKGTVLVDGVDFTTLGGETLRRQRRKIQIVFQDPYACLNPRMTAADIVAEPLECFGLAEGAARSKRIRQLFDQVGLPSGFFERRPAELSGGQRQRLGIARALAAEPSIIVADEAVAALDVSIRSQILNLLNDVQRDNGVAYLFISHDLSVVRYLAEQVAVMYLGAIVEQGAAETVFSTPAHPYTRALIASVPATHPSMRQRAPALSGEVPSPFNLPSGCRFRSRCPIASEICSRQRPEPREVARGQIVACHHASPGGDNIIEKTGQAGL